MIAIYIIGILIVVGTIAAFIIPTDDEPTREVSSQEIIDVLYIILHTYQHTLSQHEKDCIRTAINDYEQKTEGES